MLSFSALCDPTRRRIVERLAGVDFLSASEIACAFSQSPPAISQHLKILREAQLVRVKKRAQQRLYSLNPVGVDAVSLWALQQRQIWNQRFDALEAHLARVTNNKP